MTSLSSLGREKQLVGHLQRALDNGLKQSAFKEQLPDLAIRIWPDAGEIATTDRSGAAKHAPIPPGKP
jgi:hypothetical protein